jgi:hypothetical protein
MQWRWSIPLSALLVLIVITPLYAQAPETGSEAMPVEALHLVQTRDNLHLLAAYYYGDARQWVRIYETNRGAIQNPSVIQPGQILHLLLSPDWTPAEPYNQWKIRVGGVVPPAATPPSKAPEQTSTLPKGEEPSNGAVKNATVGALDGGKSPQDTFTRATAAAERNDMRAFFRLVSPDAHAQMGFVMVMGARMGIAMKAQMEKGDGAAAEKELDALLKKHGVKEWPQDAPPVDPKDQQAVRAVARQMFDGVEVIALVEDLQALMGRLGFEGGSMKIKKIAEGDLTDLKINGDHATATVGGKPGAFVKVNGRWYMDPELKT